VTARVSVYIATSLDGYIARRDGSLDWLDEANATAPEGEDFGFRTFMESVDTIVMGRKTYEKILSFGQWSYGETPVVVLSRNVISFPKELPEEVSHSSETPRDLLDRLSGNGVKHVYVDGGATIQGFLADGLVDEITVTVIPVILGGGISLFGPLEEDVQLTHVRTRAFAFGFVQSVYSVRRDAPSRPIEPK
jgi:dihydrofolate reductase